MTVAVNRRRKWGLVRWSIGLAAVALTIAVFAQSALAGPAAPITSQTVSDAIKAAKTAEDHEHLAAYYKGQAAAAAENVKRHEEMIGAYGKAGKSGATMRSHCEQLIKAYRAEQKQFEALEKEHEKQAKAMKPAK